ncbi:MAG: hypothetical protein WCN98_01250 [Verrucomicrobiaceae bacterium]
MSLTSPTPSSRPLSIFVGVLAAFASFALIAAILQFAAGGNQVDPLSVERLKKKSDIAAEQNALIEKYGLKSNAEVVIANAVTQIKSRKVEATTAVVPGSPTAIKQAAVAPAPAVAPAAPAPAAPAPTPK